MRMIVVAAALLAAAACSNDPTAPLDTAFEIGVGETVSVNGAGLTVKFVRVTEDSRCPSSVVCVWEGNGRIELDVRHEGTTERFGLNTSQGATEVAVGAYRIRLERLAPAPVEIEPIPAGTYRATLVVDEVGAICTQEARPALTIGLKDAVTGATSGFADVAIVARDGAYADSAVMATYPSEPYNGPVPLAFERRGTYDLTVRAEGYIPWTHQGVTVTGDVCHVVTQAFTALLVR